VASGVGGRNGARLRDCAWAVGDGQGGRRGDGVSLSVVGEGCSKRTVGGESGHDLSGVNIGGSCVDGLGGGSTKKSQDSESGTHLEGIRWYRCW